MAFTTSNWLIIVFWFLFVVPQANFTSLSKHVFSILIAYSFILLLCAGCWEKSKHVYSDIIEKALKAVTTFHRTPAAKQHAMSHKLYPEYVLGFYLAFVFKIGYGCMPTVKNSRKALTEL